MNNQEIQTKLLAPFNDSDIEWRLQWTSNDNTSGLAVPYVDNRAIQSRLDDVVGIGNWKNEYIPWHSAMYVDSSKNKRQVDSQICGISIYFAERSEWITKYDGAEDSEIEAIKGGLSDSMKRAAVQWGVGRYLYSMDSVFVEVESDKKGRPVFKKGQRSKLDAAHQECVKKLFGQTATGAAPNTSKPPAPVQSQAKAPSAQPPPAVQPSQVTQPAAPAQQPPPQEPQAPAVVQNTEPANSAFCVVQTSLHPSAKHGRYTNLQLRDTGGKVIQAFMPGENPGLIPGAWIVNASISSKMSEGIVFHSLDGFELVPAQAAA